MHKHYGAQGYGSNELSASNNTREPYKAGPDRERYSSDFRRILT